MTKREKHAKMMRREARKAEKKLRTEETMKREAEVIFVNMSEKTDITTREYDGFLLGYPEDPAMFNIIYEGICDVRGYEAKISSIFERVCHYMGIGDFNSIIKMEDEVNALPATIERFVTTKADRLMTAIEQMTETFENYPNVKHMCFYL